MPAPVSISQWFRDDVATPPSPTLMQGVYKFPRTANLWPVHGGAVRARMHYCLSRFLVVSVQNGGLDEEAVWCFHRMLYHGALGNFRDIIRNVTYRNTVMAIYLTYLGSVENPGSSQFADENYARELIQLFTLGLFRRNDDGSFVLDGNNEKIETYDPTADVRELSKAFTGFYFPRLTDRFGEVIRPYSGDFGSLNAPGTEDETLLRYNLKLLQLDGELSQRSEDPFFFPTDHFWGEMTFLGSTIPDRTPADIGYGTRDQTPSQQGTDGSPNWNIWYKTKKAEIFAHIDECLDVIFADPNFPRFVADRMLKAFGASNASPERYTATVNAFRNGTFTLPDGGAVGSGQLGDMTALAAALMFHPEALGTVAPQGNRPAGKARYDAECIQHLFSVLLGRGYDQSTDATAFYNNGTNISPDTYLPGQTGNDTSVFSDANLDATPPGTALSAAGYLSPELSIYSESTLLDYLTTLTDVLSRLEWSPTVPGEVVLVGLSPTEPDQVSACRLGSWLALSDVELRNRVNLEMLQNRGRPETLALIDQQIAAWTNTASGISANAIALSRIRAALFIAAASDEFRLLGA